MTQNLLSILVSNHFGVLMRVTTIFSRRACNIKSLTVAETEDPAVSRVTILFETDEDDKVSAGQIEKLLQKQEDVIRAACLPMSSLVIRELLMVKVKNSPELERDMEVLQVDYNTKILSTADGVSVIEFTGNIRQTEDFILLMRRYGLVEICRTGSAAMAGGSASIYEG